MQRANRKWKFFKDDDSLIPFVSSKGHQRRPGTKKISEFNHGEDPLFVEFVENIFQWEPEKRFTPEQAFNHPWISDFIDQLQSNAKDNDK